MNTQLFEGERVRLAPLDADKDAEVEARWTQDPEYLRLLEAEPVRPLSTAQVKRKYEAIEREARDKKNLHHFNIRTRADDRLVGFIRLYDIEWAHGVGRLALAIGDPNDRGQGCGGEALQLALRYAFGELNLYRLTAITFEYNPRAIKFLGRAGFLPEARRRQAIHRDGRRWDVIVLGILRDEWLRSLEVRSPQSQVHSPEPG